MYTARLFRVLGTEYVSPCVAATSEFALHRSLFRSEIWFWGGEGTNVGLLIVYRRVQRFGWLNCKSWWSWVDDFGSGIFGEVEEEFPCGKLME